MKGIDIIEAVNNVDEKLLSSEAPNKKRTSHMRIPLIAAAILLGLGCVVVGATSRGRVLGTFAPIETGTHGYTASFELKKYEWIEFKGDINEAPDIILEQYAAYTPPPVFANDRNDPGIYGKIFSTYDEAADYLGLDALKRLTLPFDEDVGVMVVGDEEGKVTQIKLFCDHILITGDPSTGSYGGAFFATIFTENTDISSPIAGGDWGDYDPGKIEHKEFVTSNGVVCQYTEVGVGDRTRQMVQGYIVDNGSLYELDVTFDDGDLELATEILRNWAEQF